MKLSAMKKKKFNRKLPGIQDFRYITLTDTCYAWLASTPTLNELSELLSVWYLCDNVLLLSLVKNPADPLERGFTASVSGVSLLF